MASTDIIKPLHGLRGAAALTVVVGHLAYGSGAASLGVLLFFLISGFLMGRLYLETPASGDNLGAYALARVARVYPLFALVIIGTGLFNALTGANIFKLGLADVPLHLMLMGDASTVWTISAEFQFYGFFLLIWLVRGWVGSTAAVVFALLALTSLIGFTIGPDAGRIALAKYLHLFVLGLAIAWVVDRVPARAGAMARAALPFSVAGYFAVFVFFDRFADPYLIYQSPVATAVCAALLVSCLLAGQCGLNRVLSLPVATWLGEISFSVYLLHRHAEWLVNSALGWETSAWIAFPLKVGLTLAMAQLAYRMIEIPARRSLRKLGGKARLAPQSS